jgi:hypothetical protein
MCVGVMLTVGAPALAAAAPAGSGPSGHAVLTAKASSSYSVPIDVRYAYVRAFSDHVIGHFIHSESKCVEGENFTFKQSYDKDGTPDNRKNDATKFEVDTSSNCFFEKAVAVYEVGIGTGDGKIVHGPIKLTVKQVGPRYFVSECTDSGAIQSTCSVVLAPAKPTVVLRV